MPEQALFALAWDLDGYEKLLLKNSEIKERIEEFKQRLLVKENKRRGNMPNDLKKFRDDLEVYCKGVYSPTVLYDFG